MLAGSSDYVSGGYNKVGVGGIDLATTTWRWGGLTAFAFWQDDNPNRPFDPSENGKVSTVNGYQCIENWKFYAHKDYKTRIAVSWLNNPDNANISRIPNTYTLEILDKNGHIVNVLELGGSIWPVVKAANQHQGFQVVEMIHAGSSSADLYTARVCQTDNHDNNRFDMGFAVSNRKRNISGWDQ